jgi:hypothetical protein
VNVTIYVEGGGDQGKIRADFREGFTRFFQKVCPPDRRPRIIPGRSRSATFDMFKTALRQAGPADFLILLVDSEDAVDPSHTPWRHLREREGDGWARPRAVAEDQAHLMVQCMESWFLADREALATFYGQGFRPGALPSSSSVERVSKHEVLAKLKAASRGARTRGEYHKTKHGFALLALIDPAKVRATSPHAGRLCKTVADRLRA